MRPEGAAKGFGIGGSVVVGGLVVVGGGVVGVTVEGGGGAHPGRVGLLSQGFTVGIGEAVGLGVLQELSQEQSSQKKPQRVVESCSDSPPSSGGDKRVGMNPEDPHALPPSSEVIGKPATRLPIRSFQSHKSVIPTRDDHKLRI